MIYLRQIVQEEVMKTIKLFTIGFAWACWLLALVIWGKLSWTLLIGGVIPYLVQNQFNKDEDKKNKKTNITKRSN